MTFQWTAAIFTYYILQQIENTVESSVFMEAYLEGAAGIIGSVLLLLPLLFF